MGRPKVERCRCPSNADGADEHAHPVFLSCKDVLDARADHGLERVRPPGGARHRAARRLLAVNAADEPVRLKERLVGFGPVGRVGPDPACSVGFGEQILAQPRAFVSRRVAGLPLPDQAVVAVDCDVVLTAEGRNRDVDGGLGKRALRSFCRSERGLSSTLANFGRASC